LQFWGFPTCKKQGLAKKYTEFTGKPRLEKLFDMINWAETLLGSNKEMAHVFRILRNLLHGQTILSEQDVSEAIRHITILINLLYPPTSFRVLTNYICQNCQMKLQITIPTQENYIGHVFTPTCPACAQKTPVLVF